MGKTNGGDPTTVFVGGLHRSGTTLLASIMAGHPQISGFRHTGAPEDEGQHLQTVVPTDEHHGGPGRFAFTPEAHLTEASPYAAADHARRLRAQWNRYWDLSRPVLLEKSPPNLTRFRFLQQVFPGSKFILAIRHPIPVTLSTRKWTPALSHRRLVEHWVHAHHIAFSDAAYLDHFMVVTHENLSREPAETMAKVAAFLGVPAWFDVTGLDPAVTNRYFDQWRSEVVEAGLAAGMVDLEDAVNGYGYSLEVKHVAHSGDPRDRRPVS